jgi:putative DNA primase/helicase
VSVSLGRFGGAIVIDFSAVDRQEREHRRTEGFKEIFKLARAGKPEEAYRVADEGDISREQVDEIFQEIEARKQAEAKPKPPELVVEAPGIVAPEPVSEEESIRAQAERMLGKVKPVEDRAAEIVGWFKAKQEAPPKSDEPEADEEEGEAGVFGDDLDEVEPDEEAQLSPGAPYDNAREYARRFCFREGFLATYCWHGDLWQWNGRTYQKMNEDDLRASVYRFLDRSFKIEVAKDGTFQRNRFRPKPSDVNALIDGLKSGLAMSADWYPPMWLHTKTKGTDVWVFGNGVLDIQTGELRPPSPKLWVHGAVDFDWNPEAMCPVWDGFMEDIFPGDQESKEFIEEWLGYSKTEDIRFQKGALFIGDPRSGKGTILTVLEAFVGADRFVSLSLNGWMKDDKSLEPLIGKTVGAFPDVRLKSPKSYGEKSYDAGGLDHASAEMLLKLTGGDKVTIARKYVKAWEGKLPIKMVLVSNVVPNFNDVVLPTRFIKVAFDVSFLNKEDITLPKRLEGELSGIARRALAGYQRAVKRGRFVQPKSGLRLKERIEDEIDPFVKFVRETFVIDPNGTVMIGMFELRWGNWCQENARPDLIRMIKKPHFKKRLRSIPGLTSLDTTRPERGKPRCYTFLSFRDVSED